MKPAPGTAKAPILEARDLSYTVDGRSILTEISVSLRPGLVHALVGPNGAGKTTLLRLLAGELAPSSGAVLLEGRPVSAYSAEELAQRRAVLPQQTVLQFMFRAEEVVWMGRYPHLRDRRRVQADHHAVVSQAMRSTETEHLAERPYPLLSGGERAGLDLARVLAQETPVLLLDEPNASLDVRHQMLVLELMRRLANEGAAVLAIVHDLSLAASADVVWLLNRGELVAAGSPDTVMTAAILEQVYRWPVTVLRRPDSSAPLVVPLLPGHVPVSVSCRVEDEGGRMNGPDAPEKEGGQWIGCSSSSTG